MALEQQCELVWLSWPQLHPLCPRGIVGKGTQQHTPLDATLIRALVVLQLDQHLH